MPYAPAASSPPPPVAPVSPLGDPVQYNPPTPPTTTTIGAVALNPAAPLSPVQPTTNPLINAGLGLGPVIASNAAMGQVVGPVVSVIALGLNAIMENLKNEKWFPDHLTPWILLLLTSIICIVLWFFYLHDPIQAIENIFGIFGQAHVNYHGTQVAGLSTFKPVAPENKWSVIRGGKDLEATQNIAA